MPIKMDDFERNAKQNLQSALDFKGVAQKEIDKKHHRKAVELDEKCLL